MARRKIKKVYPSARSSGIVRFTPCTPSEVRRRAHSITLRVGGDMVEWVRQAAKRHVHPKTGGETRRVYHVYVCKFGPICWVLDMGKRL